MRSQTISVQAALAALLFFVSLSADPLYSYKNINLNYLDWSGATEKKTSQKDFAYVGVEGGFGYDSFDFYGYLNLENPTKSYNGNPPDTLRYVGFSDLDIKLRDAWKLHIQNFYLNGDDFRVNNFVVGLAYKYSDGSGFWIKPFLGMHYTSDTYFNDLNGYMTGWVLHYPFAISGEQFSLFQWNEIEFGRKKNFYEDSSGNPTGDGKSYGFNGAVSLWWYHMQALTSGVQYRYAKHKLGSLEYQSALIYTLKYNF